MTPRTSEKLLKLAYACMIGVAVIALAAFAIAVLGPVIP